MTPGTRYQLLTHTYLKYIWSVWCTKNDIWYPSHINKTGHFVIVGRSCVLLVCAPSSCNIKELVVRRTAYYSLNVRLKVLFEPHGIRTCVASLRFARGVDYVDKNKFAETRVVKNCFAVQNYHIVQTTTAPQNRNITMYRWITPSISKNLKSVCGGRYIIEGNKQVSKLMQQQQQIAVSASSTPATKHQPHVMHQ